jgi:hypothetical protein
MKSRADVGDGNGEAGGPAIRGCSDSALFYGVVE